MLRLISRSVRRRCQSDLSQIPASMRAPIGRQGTPVGAGTRRSTTSRMGLRLCCSRCSLDRPFQGETVSVTISSILGTQPGAHCETTPASIRRLLRAA